MCDTLSNTTSLLPNFKSYDKFIPVRIPSKSITEPDNGHKAETIDKLDYKLEPVRLKTFESWKSDAVRAEDLAKAGFYFLNNSATSDLVKCAFCNAEICSWESGDDALQEHIRWSPNCPFVREKCPASALAFLSQTAGQDVCGNAEILGNSMPESETFRLLSNLVRSYDDEKVRLESFASWPKSSKQAPAVLAAAGFYYRGIGDHAVCFACSGALKEWKDEDDPWEQHALWFPKCRHVVANKGAEYIKEVQRKFKSVPSTTLTKEDSEERKCVYEQNHSPPPDDGILRCKICDSNERNVIFIPCKHILACGECSRQLSNCPVCRERIDDRMIVFLS